MSLSTFQAFFRGFSSRFPPSILPQWKKYHPVSDRSSSMLLKIYSNTRWRSLSIRSSDGIVNPTKQQQQQQQQHHHQQQIRMESSESDTMVPNNYGSYTSDLVVVLDMDECLIHSQFKSAPSTRYAYQTQQQQTLWGNNRREDLVDSFQIMLPDGDIVNVNQRPHLKDFLERISDKYETHVFTAAMEVYAKPVLDTLDPQNTIFDGRWYRDSCSQTKDGAFVKNLEVLNRNESRMVLVDNNPLSFLANPSNGILVSSFYDDPSDGTLLAVLSLLEELEEYEDVRPVLDDRFGLKSALKEVAG